MNPHPRNAWLWGLVTGLVSAVAFAAYLSLRLVLLPAPDPAWLVPEAAFVCALLAGLATAFAISTTRRLTRAAVADLAAQVEALCDNPGRLPLALLPHELLPLQEPIEALAACYRKALAELVAVHEAVENLRKMQERTSTENGFSHSTIHRAPTNGAAGAERRGNRMVCRLTPTLHWIAATPALLQFLGRRLTALSARSFTDIVAPDDVPLIERTFQTAIDDGEAHAVTFRIKAAQGKLKHVQMDVQTRYTAEGAPLHLRCHFLDVSERVRTEAELHRRSVELARVNENLRQINMDLQRLKESYRDLYHQAPVMYFSLDAQGCFAACNETMMLALGYAREDLFGQPYTRILTPTGVRAWQAAVTRPGHKRPKPHPLTQSCELEAQWVKKDGTVIDVWLRSVPLLSPENRFVRSRSTAQDVTERNRLAHALADKAHALEQANIQLRKINQELDQFTYVVSHDLKEPLRTLEAFTSFLGEDYGPQLGPGGRELLDHLRSAGQRMASLIDNLLHLSRAGRVISAVRPFDLAEAVRVARNDLSDLIQRKGATVRSEGTLPWVSGDMVRIIELLANLVGNGLKYNQSERPEVIIGSVPQAAGEGPAPFTTVFVRDNGIGIDPLYHDQIFGLFKRLHRREEYEGSGAGLAICKKIIEAHGGRIWVESAPGHGATFSFTLPLAPRAEAPSPAAGPPPPDGPAAVSQPSQDDHAPGASAPPG